MQLMSKWRFRPATVSGQITAVKAVLELNPQSAAATYSPLAVQEIQTPVPAQVPSGPDPTWQPKTETEFLARGYASIHSQKNSKALTDAEAALRLSPDDVMAINLHGLACHFRSGQRQQAVADYLTAIQLDHYGSSAYNNLGFAYRELGQFGLAKANLDKALEIEPWYLPARENRAKQGDVNAEMKDVLFILGLAPAHKWQEVPTTNCQGKR
jgi:tetratricopeptide (TPR) repeat protein